MKYRYGGGRAARPICFPFLTPEASLDAARTPSNFTKKVPAHSISFFHITDTLLLGPSLGLHR